MRGAIGLLLLALVALDLGGCNLVVSPEPWFTAANAIGAPVLRNGLWLTDDADCKVRELRPAERWPKCAKIFVVRDGEWLSLQRDQAEGDAGYKWESVPSLIASGDPPIVQTQMEGEDATRVYVYLALRPTGFDEAGRVTSLEDWWVQCGPLPPDATVKSPGGRDAVEDSYVTDQPFPGLTVEDHDCTAADVDTLRGAAKLSEPLERHGRMHWIRDGWR
jgi:hypothetical protein